MFHNKEKILFKSVIKDDYDTFLQKLFDYSSLINLENEKGETILHYISQHGLIDKYYACINMGAIEKTTNEGNNLLHYASKSGKDNFLIVELVKSGILPNMKNNKGETSLHLAKNEKIANYLQMWCERHNVKITELIDNENNRIIDTAKKLNNLEVYNYWKQQPIFKIITH